MSEPKVDTPELSGSSASPAAWQSLREAVEGGHVAAHEPTGSHVIDALLVCADATNTEIDKESISAAVRVRPSRIEHAARALGMVVRPVDLTRDPDWWKSDAECLVVEWQGIACPVFPVRGHQHISLPDRGLVKVTAELAAGVASQAWGIVPVLGREQGDLRAAWKLGWAVGGRRDLLTIALLAVGAVVLGTLIPIVSGTIVGELIPTGETRRILVVTVILILASILSACIVVGQSIIAQRMSNRFGLRLTSAMYERVFRLRPSFHRHHAPGELAGRLAGVEAFATGISVAVPSAVSLLALILASTFVLVRISPLLTAAVVGLSALVLILTAIAIPRFLRDAQSANELSLELNGSTFSILGGIAKIRAAGAENRMLNRWVYRFAREQAWSRDQGRRAVVLGVISTIPAALIPLLLVVSEILSSGGMGLGEFTTATAAAAQAAGAMAGLVPVALSAAALLPIFRALRPLLEADPEPRGSAAGDPGPIDGDVRLEGLSFAYDDGAPVLESISMHVSSGSMTAIVGASGSGKSTIIRLLLGLEQPTSGSLLIDGRALEAMDRTAVLAQMGVVPQDAALAPGSILENILGTSAELGEENAWRAAELAGLDSDIRAMPMGMQTVISDGASTLSGGQRQRIMIARALVKNPRILILDEATSALDNRTQEHVANSIAELGVTRIVVAHRLSTIAMADHIVVLERGHIVESGTFAELMASDGVFRRLAARQVA